VFDQPVGLFFLVKQLLFLNWFLFTN